MNSRKPYLIIVTGRPAADKSTLAKWLSKELDLPVVSAEIIQIVCDANSEILFQRFKERAENGNRHPGRGDAKVQDELWQSLTRELSPVMDVGGKMIVLNTDNFSSLDYPKILAGVKAYVDTR